MIKQRLMAGGFLAVVLVGIASTVYNILVEQFLFATVNGAACLVPVWAAWLIFMDAG